MNTDPAYLDGFDDASSAIEWHIEKLTAAWGRVSVDCDGYRCSILDFHSFGAHQAPTLLEALRLAVEAVEGTP